MRGYCDICHEYTDQLFEKEYKYPVVCGCCNGNYHTQRVSCCKNCVHIEPETTNISVRKTDIKNLKYPFSIGKVVPVSKLKELEPGTILTEELLKQMLN